MTDLIQSFCIMLETQKMYSPHTIVAYRQDLHGFKDFVLKNKYEFTASALGKIPIHVFRMYLSERKSTDITRRSISRSLSAIRSFYRWLGKTKGVDCPALEVLRYRTGEKAIPKCLSQEEALKVVDYESEGVAWVQARDKAILLLLYGAGLRISEALSLKRRDYEGKPSIKVRGKGKKDRIVPLAIQVLSAIGDYLSLCPHPFDDDSPLFVGVRGCMVNQRIIRHTLARIKSELEIDGHLTPHTLRHSCATHLLDNGGSIRVIQGLLGHESINTTQTYLQTSYTRIDNVYRLTHPREVQRLLQDDDGQE